MLKNKSNTKFYTLFCILLITFSFLLCFFNSFSSNVVLAAESDGTDTIFYNFRADNNSTPTWQSGFGGFTPTYSIMFNSSNFGSDNNVDLFFNSNSTYSLTLNSFVFNNQTFNCFNNNISFNKGSTYSGTDYSQLTLNKGTFNLINYTGSSPTKYIVFVLPSLFYFSITQSNNFNSNIYSMSFSLSSYNGVVFSTIGDSILSQGNLSDISLTLISTNAVLTPEQEEYYNSGYTAGYNDGKTAGVNSVNTEQYFDNGYTAGYNDGKTAGIASANDYSFISLFGAIFDAPVKTFTSLFNFDLLGVNILSLITALFTLCVIVVIVRFCFGGK